MYRNGRQTLETVKSACVITRGPHGPIRCMDTRIVFDLFHARIILKCTGESIGCITATTVR